MTTRVAVVVPGIMGSVLFFRGGSEQRDEIWSENFLTNYRRLLSNPTLIRWNEIPAESLLLENVYASKVLRKWPKYRLWDKLLQHLNCHPEFGNEGQTLKYSYDWRQSLLESARHLGAQLDEHAGDLEDRGISTEELRYVFFTHSMGGLVVRIALALGVLAPKLVDKIVHIGSPLEGAPVAFRSAYESGSLPFLRELSNIFHRKNADIFFRHLLDNVKTFPSIYQLMPPVGQDYLFYSPAHKSNPLVEEFIAEDKRLLANEAHEQLEKAEAIVSGHKIETFTVYSEWHQDKTDLEYHVQQQGAPNPGYEITFAQGVNDGDGTVPKWSAAGSISSSKQNPIWNVAHATMCNNRAVVGLLPGILSR